MFEVFAQHEIDGLLGDASAVFAEEERAIGDGGFLAIALKSRECRAADGDLSRFIAFAGDDEIFSEEIDIFHVEGAKFRDAQAAGIE